MVSAMWCMWGGSDAVSDLLLFDTHTAWAQVRTTCDAGSERRLMKGGRGVVQCLSRALLAPQRAVVRHCDARRHTKGIAKLGFVLISRDALQRTETALTQST